MNQVLRLQWMMFREQVLTIGGNTHKECIGNKDYTWFVDGSNDLPKLGHLLIRSCMCHCQVQRPEPSLVSQSTSSTILAKPRITSISSRNLLYLMVMSHGVSTILFPQVIHSSRINPHDLQLQQRLLLPKLLIFNPRTKTCTLSTKRLRMRASLRCICRHILRSTKRWDGFSYTCLYVHVKFDLSPETLYLTINTPVSKNYSESELQLLGIGALLIASK